MTPACSSHHGKWFTGITPCNLTATLPVVKYRCESWIIKKAEYQRIAVLEKTLESPRDCKTKPVHPKGDHPWVFIGRTDDEAEAWVLCHLMWKANSLEKTLMLGKIEGRRRRGRQRMRWLDGITDSMEMNLSKLKEWRTEQPSMLQPMGFGSRMWLSDWTAATTYFKETEDAHTSVLALVEEENFGYQLNN